MTKTIKIHWTKPKSELSFPIISWLIRLFTWFNSSHVLVEFEGGRCFQVYFNKFELVSMQYILSKHKIQHTKCVTLSDTAYAHFVANCINYSGTVTQGYYFYLVGSWLGNVLHFTNPFHIKFNKYGVYKVNVPARSCSTLLYVMLNQADLISKVESGNRGVYEVRWFTSLDNWKVPNLTPKGLFHRIN